MKWIVVLIVATVIFIHFAGHDLRSELGAGQGEGSAGEGPVVRAIEGHETAGGASPEGSTVGARSIDSAARPSANRAEVARLIAVRRMTTGISPEEAVAEVEAMRGRPAVVFLYRSDCSRSQAMLRQMASAWASAPEMMPEVLVFAFEGPAVGGLFSTYTLRPWESGELDRAMSRVGIYVGARFSQPLVAVLDADGSPAGQWQGLTSVEPIMETVAAVGYEPGSEGAR